VLLNVAPSPLSMSRLVMSPFPSELQLYCAPALLKTIPTSSASRAIIGPRTVMSLPPEKPLTDAEVDELYGLEPVIGVDSLGADKSAAAELVTVSCPYCGEAVETTADVSAGPCIYVEDCQICCQPIEMELRVDDDGTLGEVLTRRGDS
jgi:hypothetical protein